MIKEKKTYEALKIKQAQILDTLQDENTKEEYIIDGQRNSYSQYSDGIQQIAYPRKKENFSVNMRSYSAHELPTNTPPENSKERSRQLKAMSSSQITSKGFGLKK